MTTSYTVDFFIEKFEGIPENRWIVGDYINDRGCCAYGHCGMSGAFMVLNDQARQLYEIFKGNVNNYPNYINDGHDKRYPQSTPKQRILAALYDIKKMQEKKEPVTVAPSRPEPINQVGEFYKIIPEVLDAAKVGQEG